MSQAKLVAQAGRQAGSSASRRMRAEGHIPGVLYGHGMEPLSLSVERRDLRVALSGPAGVNTVLALHVDGSKYDAVVKELQRHPVKRTVSHIDFLQVNMNEEITVSIPLRVHGEAAAVLAEDGMIDPAVDSIEVRTTPANIPPEFVYDVTDMQPTDVIRLEDLVMPSGVTPTGDPDMAIITVIFTAAAAAEIEALDAAVAEEAAAEAAEAGEGEAAEAGGEGEAATADAAEAHAAE